MWPEQIPAQANQRWTLLDRNNGEVAIQSKLHSTSYMLEVAGHNGVEVILYPENVPSTNNQRWTLVPLSAVVCATASAS